MQITELGEILSNNELASLINLGIQTAEDVRNAEDEKLMEVKGIGPATVSKMRQWAELPPAQEGEALSTRYMLLKAGGEKLDVAPGDVIPAKFGAEELVKEGKARWR